MLAIDAARTSGFRDSLYYFRRNPLAFKLNATQAEKDALISAGKLGGHLRTRAVTLITARSAYKLHGAKTVVAGRWVRDDYYEDRAAAACAAEGLEPGALVGELIDPRAAKAAAAAPDDAPDRERAGEWGMYRPGAPTTLFGASGFGPFSEGPLSAPKKAFYAREGVSEENWMAEAARRTREADADWRRGRAAGLKPCGGVYGENTPADKYPEGVYEPHAAIVVCGWRRVLCNLACADLSLDRPVGHAADACTLGAPPRRPGQARRSRRLKSGQARLGPGVG
jgi:chromatin structure-remodeling complex protein RSC7